MTPHGATTRARFAALAVSDLPTEVGIAETTEEVSLARGDVIGRYVIISQIGRGGMGVVYAAYDPELDRKVAVKLLLAGPGETSTAGDARTRLLREAQALAQLSHPAVVTVHDVGTVGDRVWLAMEFIDGTTLAQWLRQRPRPWRELLDTFRRAGEGLAAAHAAGLVHRDFKPDNVMVGRDGRVVVMDFGLARAERPPRHQPADLRVSASALRMAVTQDGAVMGTPQYMAPEQWLGDATDARTDQFAFCVALWEALYNQRPFGDTPNELALHVTSGHRRDPPPAKAPSWLRHALERGLSVAAAARWPDMPALLAALAGGARRRRRTIAVATLLTLLALASAFATHRRWQHRELVAACAAEGERIREVWDPAARDRLRDALLAVPVPYARSTLARLVPALDARADAWQRARTQACTNTLVDRTWDLATAERARACLADVRWSLEGFLHSLAAPDAPLLQAALTAAARLPDPAPCIDPLDLANAPRLPPGHAAAAEAAAIRRGLMRARSLQISGRFNEGAALGRFLIARADALAWLPLAAQTRLTAAELTDRAGDGVQAEALATAAMALAAEAGEDGLLADIAIVLTEVVGDNLARHDDGLRWGRLAEGLLRRQRAQDGIRGARLLASVASVHESRGDYAAAEALAEQALAAWEKHLGPDHPALNAPLNNLAIIRYVRGDKLAAQRLLERALALAEQSLGPDHPTVAAMLNNLGNVHLEADRLDQARALYTRSLTIREAAFGPTNPVLISPLFSIATVDLQREDYAAAEPPSARALALAEASVGPDHPEYAAPLENLALIDRARGELDRALTRQSRALAIRQSRLGPDHSDVIASTINLAELHLATAELDLAARTLDTALAAIDRLGGQADDHRLAALLTAADIALARRRPADAIPLLEQALALQDQLPSLRARARFALARALHARDPADPRALTLAREALPDLTAPRRLAAEDWLLANAPAAP